MASYRRNLNLVKKHLQSGESIVTSIEGVYEKNDWTRNGILVATENRIIFFADKFIGFNLESFPFRNISSYEHSKNFMGHEIKFYASGNEVKIKWISSSNLNSFNDYINSNLGQQFGSKEIIQTESVASQLDKLAKLLEKNLITEVEFIKMKHDITSNKGHKNLTFKPEAIKEKIVKNKLPENNNKQKKKYKSLFHILIAGLMVFVYVKACDTDENIEESKFVKYKNNINQYSKANLNIRKLPNTKGNVLKVIKPNEKIITYDSIVNGFVMVLDDDGKEYGWASNKYLQKSPLSKKQLIDKSKQQEKASLSLNPLGIDIKVIKELEYNTVPFDKWEEWGNPKTLEGTNNTYWVVLLPKSNISFVAKKKSNFIVFADFGEEKAINYLKNRLRKNKIKVKKQFSSWDGSNRVLTKYIKNNMNDAGSYEHVKTVYWVYDDYIIVKTTFRGTNAYGGKVLNSVRAKISFDGVILEIL